MLDFAVFVAQYSYVYMYIVKCRCNMVQYIIILHMALPLQWQRMNQIYELQQILHISPSLVSYGVSILKKFEKIDDIKTAPHRILI